jgi:nucleoside-diphosphate-sugar epimerase
VKQAFVTGGSGFLGHHLIGALRQHGYSVKALARSNAAAAAVKSAGAEPAEGELNDAQRLGAGMAGCDVVFHVAGLVAEWGRREEMYSVNVKGTAAVLAAAGAAGVPKLVHVSTEAVLTGGPPLVMVDETRPRPARPFGIYAITKGLAEEQVLAANSNRLQACVVRPRLIWGPGDINVLPRFVKAVQSGSFAWIAGGHYRTSSCYVANACEGMILAAEEGRAGEVYFLTDGEPVEFREFLTDMLRTQGVVPGGRTIPRGLARAMASVAEASWSVLRLAHEPPLTRAALLRIGEEVTVVDTKARRELGYRTAVSREDGLAALAQVFR